MHLQAQSLDGRTVRRSLGAEDCSARTSLSSLDSVLGDAPLSRDCPQHTCGLHSSLRLGAASCRALPGGASRMTK